MRSATPPQREGRETRSRVAGTKERHSRCPENGRGIAQSRNQLAARGDGENRRRSQRTEVGRQLAGEKGFARRYRPTAASKGTLARRDEFDKAKQLSQGHLKLREQMTRDLAVLELALRNVQARKAQQRPVYSLVPYKGKHGSSAKPIYIEVTEASVAVHSGPTTIAGFEWSSETTATSH